jgi:Fur family zinc uptake transcriptional regulator
MAASADRPTAEFSARTTVQLHRAASLCAARGAQLTELRRHVLGLILEAEAPLGAYELLERLRATRGGAAPPTIYRALDFLLANGLIHRLERLAAFVGCVGHEPLGEAAHAAQFLICRDCGRVTELEDDAIAHALAIAAARAGFAMRSATVEAEGVCTHCAETHAPALSAPHTP